jgi:phage minor structural protein
MSNKNLYYFNDKYELQFTLSNEKEGACPYEEADHIEGLDWLHDLEFKAPANNPEAQQLANGGYVGLFDQDNNFQLFEIYLIEEEDSASGLQRAIFAQHVFNETDKLPVYDKRPQNTTATAAMDSLLEGQNKWKRGQVADLGLGSTNFYNESIRSGAKKIQETWGGELRTRITFTDNKITGFFIDLLTRRGSDTGKRITIEKDAESIKRKVDRSNIYTAIVPRGKGEQTENGGYSRRLSIADVVWSTSKGDPANKPAGQVYIGDEEARLAYGIPDGNGGMLHRFLFIEFDETEDSGLLINQGWETLQQNNKPLVSYETKIINLEAQGLTHEAVRLGDTNFILDDNFAPPLQTEARIIKLKRRIDDETQTEPTLGNFMPMFSDQGKELEELKKVVGGRAGIWDKVEQPVNDGDIENITPEQPGNVIATGSFKKVIVEWDFNPALYLAAYEVYGSAVPGFVADPSNLLWRGKGSAYAHEPGVNQEWYYRVRGINTQGVAGPLSAEVSATTARIITDDILFGAVGAAQIADLAIEAGKLADLAVTGGKLADGAVINSKIANAAVDAWKLTNGAVTNTKLGPLAVDAAKLAEGAVLEGKLGDLAVTAAKLADGSATNAKIANTAVDNAKLAALAVDAAKLADNAVTNAKVADLAINTAELANLAVANGKLAALAVDAAKLADGAATEAKIGLGAVTNTKLGALAVDAAKLAAGAATADKIADNAITNAKLADLAVSAAELADSAVTATKIGNLAVGTAAIANTAITNAKIGLLAVDTAQIAAAAVESAKIANLAVGSAALADAAITNAKIGSLAVSNGQIQDAAISSAKIGLLAVGTGAIQDAAINNAKIANLAVSGAKIANLTVGSGQIADLAVTNAKLANLAVNTAEIADAAINSAKIANLAVGNAAIANLAVTGAKIANLTVDTGQLKDAAITSAKIGSLAVGTAAIQDSAITNAKIANLAVGNAAIQDLAVTNAKINDLHGSKITASSITTEKLNVLAKNKINNFSVTGHFEGWAYGSLLEVYNSTRGIVGRSNTSANVMFQSEMFEVDPSKSYKVTLGVQCATNNGSLYWGLYAFDKDGNNIGVYNGSDTQSDWASTLNTNPYFWSSGSSFPSWYDMESYIMAHNADLKDTPKPKGVSSFFKMDPQVRYLKIRFLTYYNSAATLTHWYSPTVTEIGAGVITANQMEVGTITAASGIIANAAIESAKIASLAVGNAAIANGAINNAKIGTLAVSSGQIQDLAVTTAKIANLAVDGAKIANATITSAKISSIDAGKITTGTLTAITISGVTITGTNISGSTITSQSGNNKTTITGGYMKNEDLTYNYSTTIDAGEIYSKFGSAATRISGGHIESEGWLTRGGQVSGIDVQYPSFDRAGESHYGFASCGQTGSTGRWIWLAVINNDYSNPNGSGEYGTFQGTAYVQSNYGNTANDNVGPIQFNFGVRGGTIRPVLQWSGDGALKGGSHPKFIVTKDTVGQYRVYMWQPAYSRFASFEYQLPGGVAVFSGYSSYTGTLIWDSARTSDNVQPTRFGHEVMVNSDGGVARWQADSANYIYQNPSNGAIYFYMGANIVHTFSSNGSKSGGSILLGENRFGMSPIDSPQFLLEYIEFNIALDPAGVKVYLDEKFAEAVANTFAVFPNNGQVLEKGPGYFVIAGEGQADCRLVGERYDYQGAFWADMDTLTEQLHNEQDQQPTEEVIVDGEPYIEQEQTV